MDEIFKEEIIFDSLGAELFVDRWNELMMNYSFISLSDLLTDYMLLGSNDKLREKNKFIYNFHGWIAKGISVTSAFDVRKGRRNYIYVLKLPKIQSLSEEL